MILNFEQREKNNKRFFVVNDLEKNVMYDFFEFPNYKEMPILTNYFFNLMNKEFRDTFNNGDDYSRARFLSNLLIMYNICFDGNIIDIKTTKLLKPIYFELRFKEMINRIDFMNGKRNSKSLTEYREKLTDLSLNKFSDKTKELFNDVNNEITKNKKSDELFKEILKLTTAKDYQLAYDKALEFEKFLNEYNKKYNIKLDEG